MTGTLSHGEASRNGHAGEDDELSESGRGGGGASSKTQGPTKRTEGEAKAVEVDSSNEGDEDDQPCKKAHGPVKAKQSEQKKAKDKLEILKTLPVEIITEIFSHLYPNDLLALSKVNKQYRALLTAKSSSRLWKAARDKLELPDLVTDYFSEVQYASLIFGRTCQLCNVNAGEDVLFDAYLRLKICKHCVFKELEPLSSLHDFYPGQFAERVKDVVLKSNGAALISDLHRATVILRDLEARDKDNDALMRNAQRAHGPSPSPSSPSSRRRSARTYSSASWMPRQNQVSGKEDSSAVPNTRRVDEYLVSRSAMLREIAFHAHCRDEAYSKVTIHLSQLKFKGNWPSHERLAILDDGDKQREAKQRHLDDNAYLLRPLYDELLLSLPLSARLFAPLFAAFLVLPSVKALRVGDDDVSEQAWTNALDDIKEDLEHFRLELIARARALVLETTTDPDERSTAQDDLDLGDDDLDLDTFFSLATSFVCCSSRACEYRNCFNLVGPLGRILEHFHKDHNDYYPRYELEALESSPELDITLPPEVACAVSALLQIHKLDPATAGAAELEEAGKDVYQYVWKNCTSGEYCFRGKRAWVELLCAVKDESAKLARLKPPQYLDSLVIVMHPVADQGVPAARVDDEQ
ncbi:hypothetical protein JCM8208_004216 [Rhodotorula glutinis]